MNDDWPWYENGFSKNKPAYNSFMMVWALVQVLYYIGLFSEMQEHPYSQEVLDTEFLATGMASTTNAYGSMEMQMFGSTSRICLIICLSQLL